MVLISNSRLFIYRGNIGNRLKKCFLIRNPFNRQENTILLQFTTIKDHFVYFFRIYVSAIFHKTVEIEDPKTQYLTLNVFI